jgi:hypothetical protein
VDGHTSSSARTLARPLGENTRYYIIIIKGRQKFWSSQACWSILESELQNIISIRGKFSGFAVAQPDLANGAQFQVQIKDILVRISKIYMYDTRTAVFHTEIRDQNSMRLVIT